MDSVYCLTLDGLGVGSRIVLVSMVMSPGTIPLTSCLLTIREKPFPNVVLFETGPHLRSTSAARTGRCPSPAPQPPGDLVRQTVQVRRRFHTWGLCGCVGTASAAAGNRSSFRSVTAASFPAAARSSR